MAHNNRTPISEILAHDGKPSLRMTMISVMALAMPAIIEQIMITLVHYVDTAMVGSLGSAATASVGLTASSTWLINGFLNAASVGFSIQVAQYVGAGQNKEAQTVVGQALKFTVIFGLLLGFIAFLVSFPLPNLLGAAPEIQPAASAYFRIIACAVPFNCCVLMLSAIIRCSGDTKTPMVLNLSINLLNMIFNFLLIYPVRSVKVFGRYINMWGAGLGVAGAALGSLLALAIVSVVYLLVIFRKDSPVRLSKETDFRFTKQCLTTSFRIGLPVAFERTLMCSAQIMVTTIISGIGTAAIAAHHLAVTTEALSYLPAYGVGTAATTLIGQALGAGRKDIAKRFSTIVTYMGIIIMSFGGILLFAFAEPLISIFSTDPEVITLGRDVLRIVAFVEPFFAMSIVITGVLRGAGDTKGPFLISLITMWGVRISMAFLLAPRFGLRGVWVAMSLELVARGVLFIIRMYRGKWLDIKIFQANGR